MIEWSWAKGWCTISELSLAMITKDLAIVASSPPAAATKAS